MKKYNWTWEHEKISDEKSNLETEIEAIETMGYRYSEEKEYNNDWRGLSMYVPTYSGFSSLINPIFYSLNGESLGVRIPTPGIIENINDD